MNEAFEQYVRKPFLVEALELTEENMEEIAKEIGEFKRKGDGTPYIRVHRWIIPSVINVYAGYWLTKTGDNLRCFSKKVFEQQFVSLDEYTVNPSVPEFFKPVD